MKKALTLLELNALVRQTLELQMPDEYWVEAELSELREVRGHCYMQLIQKEQNNTPVAQAPAKCWKQTWMLVKNHFERVTGQPMRAGLKVLLCVYAQFHENYGFSWIVTDVDPTYTLGDMARKRLEIINRLRKGPQSLAGLYGRCNTSSEVVATFVAVLELCRSGNLTFERVEEQVILHFSGSDTEIEKVLESFEEES